MILSLIFLSAVEFDTMTALLVSCFEYKFDTASRKQLLTSAFKTKPSSCSFPNQFNANIFHAMVRTPSTNINCKFYSTHSHHLTINRVGAKYNGICDNYKNVSVVRCQLSWLFCLCTRRNGRKQRCHGCNDGPNPTQIHRRCR